VKYVPIDYAPRAGTSKFHWWKDTRRYLTQVVRLSLSYDPLRVFLPASLVLGLVAAGKFIFDWVARDFHVTTNTLVLLFAAFQLAAIGLLADLIVRLSRPRDQIESASS
jgi:hypothetical protein